MSYRLNKTNGDLVVELADGQIDNVSTDITLVGRNYRGFGELFNENFIKMLENFASTNSPDNPLLGQLWYDTNQQRLKIYNGTGFRTAGSPLVSPDRPVMVEGDLWINTQERKLYFYDGNTNDELTLVGPEYTRAQGKTGFETESVVDTNSIERTVLKLFIAGNLVGVLTDSEFSLEGSQKVRDYPDTTDQLPTLQIFQQGFNLVNQEFQYRGTASAALSLENAQGDRFSPDQFLAANQSTSTTGTITVNNPNGLTVSSAGINYASLKVIGTTTALELQQPSTDFALRTKISNSSENAVYIDSSARNIGIYNTSPEYTVDIDGDFRASGNTVIEGDLTVNGAASFVNTDQVRILDKNLELGWIENDDSSLTEGTDSQIDNAGITVVSKNGSKDLAWKLNTQSWTSNQDFDLVAGKVYRIGGVRILSRDTLSDTVKTATGLSRIGQLQFLNVDNINIDQNTISTSNSVDIVLNPHSNNNINVSSAKIKNLAKPEAQTDASTKEYVDDRVDSSPVAFSMDITGLTDPDDDVRSILETLVPASEKRSGTRARVIGTLYDNQTIDNINLSDQIVKSYASITDVEDPIDLDDNIELTAKSVLQDFTISDFSTTYTPSPSRFILEYRVIDGSWTHQSTNAYNI